MIKLIVTSVIAMVCIMSLLIYDFLCICRITKKEEIVEKIWSQIFRKKEYDEKKMFILIRPTFLWISSFTYLLSYEILSEMLIFEMILPFTSLLAIITSIANNK